MLDQAAVGLAAAERGPQPRQSIINQAAVERADQAAAAVERGPQRHQDSAAALNQAAVERGRLNSALACVI